MNEDKPYNQLQNLRAYGQALLLQMTHSQVIGKIIAASHDVTCNRLACILCFMR